LRRVAEDLRRVAEISKFWPSKSMVWSLFTRRRERSEIAKGRSSCPKGSAGGRWQFADARAAEAPVDARLAL
jgi:hypothetical protein